MKDTSQGAAALRTIELDQRLGGTPVQVELYLKKICGFYVDGMVYLVYGIYCIWYGMVYRT